MSNGATRKVAIGALGAMALTATLFGAVSQANEAEAEAQQPATPSSSPGSADGEAASTESGLDARRAAAQEQAALRESAAQDRLEQERAAARKKAEEKRAAEEAEAARKAAAEKERKERLAEITFGEQGEHVAELQQRLKDLGYQVTSADGVYGGETAQAVLAFQKVAGLGRDGVVGAGTKKALDNGVVPVSRHGGTGIEVDLSRQVVLIVENGRVIRTFNASSGNGERYEALGNMYVANTPTGGYSIYKQIDGVRESSLDLGSMYRPKYFTGGIAVHGSPSIPAYPASHGCIRVSNTAMDWIWSWGASVGTSVQVYY